MKLLIFKTNIANESRIKKVNALLAYNPGLMDWSIDMEDRDKVLRIEAEEADLIKAGVVEVGHRCESVDSNHVWNIFAVR